MDRRLFLNGGSMIAAATLAELIPDIEAASTAADSVHQLGKVNNPDTVAAAYRVGALGLGAAAAPYVYAFFDEKSTQKFLNPLSTVPNCVKPVLPKGKYTMKPVLRSFNIRKSEQDKLKRLKSQIQLGVNATTPLSQSDTLTWMFMNAIDIFLAKDAAGRQDQLTKFTAGNQGTELKSSPNITVDKGIVTLQVTAFGQKTKSVWLDIFDIVTKALTGSAVSTAALKGFGIPSLATDAVKFVDGVLAGIAKQNNLVTLWQTGGLEFAVTTDTDARFNMRPGLWATVDSDYVQQSNFLEGHYVEMEQTQSFRLFDKDKKAVDANYLVLELLFPQAT